jgi:cytochrome b
MSADWKVALGAYLVVGSLILLVIWVHHRLTTTRKSNWVKAALAASDPQRQTLRYRVLSDFAAPALASLFIWALWPIALVMVVKWKREAQREERNLQEQREAKEKQAAVEMSELLERISIETIEALETVHDPLHAAPAVPFGHMGASWIAFRSKLLPEDEIWSFEAMRSDDWGFQEQTHGYAAVRNGQIVAHFIKRRKKART